MAQARIGSFLILASLAVGAPALAKPGASMFMPQGELADAPSGFIEMCARDAALCMMGSSPPAPTAVLVTSQMGPTPASGAALPYFHGGAPVERSRKPTIAYRSLARTITGAGTDRKSLMKTINSDVNRHVIQMTDFASMGIGEYWRRLPQDMPIGDCEDIAIEKRARLTDAGFPVERMFYAVVFVRRLGLHTVLIARMDDGDYVLDSLTPHIVRWEESHYILLRKQVPGSPLEWERMDRNRSETSIAAVSGAGTSLPAS